MLVTIPFQPEFEAKMLSGGKSMTARTKWYGLVGDVFEAFGARFIIFVCSRAYLRDVAQAFYQQEGFGSPGDFIECWIRLHPRKGYVPNQIVYCHEFKRIV